MRSSSSFRSSPKVLSVMVSILSCTQVAVNGRTSVGSLGLPEPFQSFRPGFCLAEREMIVALNREVIRAEGETTPLGDTSRDSDPAGPVHIRVGHGFLQSSNSIMDHTATARLTV